MTETILKRPIVSEAEWLEWRSHDVTASDISALTHDHPYLSRYGLWMIKSGKIERGSLPTKAENDAMMLGRKFEAVALEVAFEDHPEWPSVPDRHKYYSHTELRIGATPDAVIGSSDAAISAWKAQVYPEILDAPSRVLIEIKTSHTSVFKKYWSDGPPRYVLDQVLIGMWLADCMEGMICVMEIAYGIKMHYFDVAFDQGRIDILVQEVSDFWKSINDDMPPEPDFGHDLETIKHGIGLTGADIDLSGDNEVHELRDRYGVIQMLAKGNKADIDDIRARMLFKMNGAERAFFNGEVVATNKVVNKKAFAVKETIYRMFKFVGE